MHKNTTQDGILNRRVLIEQPADGYRVAIDTVLLAAAVPARAGLAVLDLGCGVGGVMLALAERIPDLTATGIEIQPPFVELCRRNIAANNKSERLRVIEGDVSPLPEDLSGRFDEVVMNPPFHDSARHDASPHADRRTANMDDHGLLANWIAAAASGLKTDGVLTLINRADRCTEILALLQPQFGDVLVKYLLPKEGQAPKRVLLRARKGGAASVRETAPLVLHSANGGYTPQADAILRDMAALDWA